MNISTGNSNKTYPRLSSFSLRGIIGFICFCTFCGIVFVFWGCDYTVRIVQENRQKIVCDHLVFEINDFIVHRFSDTAGNLARRQDIIDVVVGKSIPDNEQLLQILSTLREVIGASIIYVLDSKGTVIGCSPYGSENYTLTGKNYGFRPYFIRAIQGDHASYAAVGVTTEKRGIYFSSPVRAKDGAPPLGVVVVKIDMDTIDSFLGAESIVQPAMLVSPDGIVFATNHPAFFLRTGYPLSATALQRIRSGRQFSTSPLDPLPFSLQEDIISWQGTRTLLFGQPIDMKGWRIVVLQPAPYPWELILSGSLLLLATGGMLITITLHSHKEKQLTDAIDQGRRRSLVAENAHRETMRELETIFSASMIGILLVRDGRAVNVNARMRDIFGYSQSEILNGTVEMFFPDRKSYLHFIKTYARQLARRDLEQIEYILKKKDGSLVPCTLSGKALSSEDLSKGVVWVVQDITQRKLVEKELQDARASAEAASRAKSEFLANMSHEIRTPMNGILGLSNLLLQEEVTAEQQKLLKHIRSSGQRLLSIINDILDFSKVEAGRIELNDYEFSLRELMAEQLHNLDVLAREKGLQLQADIGDDVPDALIGDAVKLSQILVNLIGNGVKFTLEGGVHLRISLQNRFNVHWVRLLFEVDDTGIGIAPAMKDTIFEAFTQEDSTLSRRYGGTGLGLAISRVLVRLMGGDIHFESVQGKGTHFFFSVPFQVVPEEQAEPPLLSEKEKQQDGLQLAGYSILLADDEFINITLAEILLSRAGLLVTSVTNGREALSAWKNGNFDCILMDIQMPEIDGYEAVQYIRDQEQHTGEHVPIIAMTAHAMDEDREKCMHVGMDGYLAKPIDGESLLALLTKYILPRDDEPKVDANA